MAEKGVEEQVLAMERFFPYLVDFTAKLLMKQYLCFQKFKTISAIHNTFYYYGAFTLLKLLAF